MDRTREENGTGGGLGLGDVVFVLRCGYIGMITQKLHILGSTFYRVEAQPDNPLVSSGFGLFLKKELIKLS